MYSSGMLSSKVTFLRRVTGVRGEFGHNAVAPVFEEVDTLPASVTFTKGVKSLRDGALDAYDYLMVRLRFDKRITRDMVFRYDSRLYAIESFNASHSGNTIQITARELVIN